MNNYIVDGYNVIYASPSLRQKAERGDMAQARIELVNALTTFVHRKKGYCTVVFDGVVPHGTGTGRVQVVSSNSRSADDIIREEARRHGRRLVVVTADNEILATARTNSADIISPAQLLNELFMDAAGSNKSSPPTDGSARPHRIAELREQSEKPNTVEDPDMEEWKRLFGE